MKPEQVVANVFGQNARDIDDATSPDSLPAWDSLGHVTLVIELESIYGVSFAPEQTLGLMSVGDIKRALQDQGATW